MTQIRLDGVTRRFGDVMAANAISLDFAAGSFTALLGPSGCGKTTLLRLIAGFEAPDAGRILFDDRLIADTERQVAPEKRGVGVVFQSYALWPHMDVAENVAYPLRMKGVDRQAIGSRVADVLGSVGLAGFGERRIDELSGGQRQRVALARCLVADAGIILFDEPLANLDMHLRAAMVEMFREVHRRTRATIVYVTHDQAEALALADRVAVMDRGRLIQVAPPEGVYHAPADERVAGFVGRGSIVSGTVAPESPFATICGALVPARSEGPRAAGAAKVLLRPESLSLEAAGLPATVSAVTYRGPVYEVRLALPTGEELVLDRIQPPRVGETVHVGVSDAWIIPSGSG